MQKILENQTLNYFNRLALPMVPKLQKLEEITRELGLFSEYLPDCGLLVYNTTTFYELKSAKKVIVSHYDLVSTFENGFNENKKFFVSNDEKVIGALDNTLTNAAILAAVKEAGLPKDTILLFTEGEETGFTGMRTFMKNWATEDMFFWNLDVTNDNYDKLVSIEYDDSSRLPNVENFISENLEKMELGYQYTRYADDTSAVLGFGGHGLSCCIPTKNYCHTYDSQTTFDKVVGYTDFLQKILTEDFLI